MIINKPWGHEEILSLNDKYCLKKIVIKPYKRLSLQYHEFKHETIVVLQGLLTLYIDGETKLMETGDSHVIPPMAIHRFSNVEIYDDIILLEASTPQLDDVVRLEDDYGRAN